jgi:hypothetical protein
MSNLHGISGKRRFDMIKLLLVIVAPLVLSAADHSAVESAKILNHNEILQQQEQWI